LDSTIERIAAYAHALKFESLTEEAVHETKRRIIDTLGCALGGYDAEPCRIARKIAGRVKSDSGARILGTSHRTLPELAAFSNGVMARYLDGNDAFPGGGWLTGWWSGAPVALKLETREAFRLGPADEEGADRLVMARRALAVSTVDGPRSTVRVYALNSPES